MPPWFGFLPGQVPVRRLFQLNKTMPLLRGHSTTARFRRRHCRKPCRCRRVRWGWVRDRPDGCGCSKPSARSCRWTDWLFWTTRRAALFSARILARPPPPIRWIPMVTPGWRRTKRATGCFEIRFVQLQGPLLFSTRLCYQGSRGFFRSFVIAQRFGPRKALTRSMQVFTMLLTDRLLKTPGFPVPAPNGCIRSHRPGASTYFRGMAEIPSGTPRKAGKK